jgi:transcriptional regulator with XRE-family HTH domain
MGDCRMSDTSRKVLDMPALAAAVETVIRHRKITMRTAAAETGLSPSTLTRLAQGQKPDADGLVTLLDWLNAEASSFAADRKQEQAATTEDPQ